jgi:hypothetical protein
VVFAFAGTDSNFKLLLFRDDMLTSSRFLRTLLARSVIGTAATFATISCEPITSPIEEPESAVPTTVAWAWDIKFQGYVNQEVPSLPSVIVLDQFRRPMVGMEVRWAVTAGGGSLRFPVSLTSGDGVATLRQWTLGPEVGDNIVTATVGHSLATSFKVVAKPFPEGDPCAGCWDY